MLVYKYGHPDRIDVLADGLIRFTQPAALNDPFETLPNLQAVREGLRESASQIIEKHGNRGSVESLAAQVSVEPRINEGLAKFQRDTNTKYAFLSLSKKRNNLLMWSHYADAHRGFVIGFDSSNAFFKRREFNVVTPLQEVKYSAIRGIVPASALNPLSDHKGVDLAKIFFFTKNRHWSYEEELRMVVNLNTADKIVEVKSGFDIHLFKFPSESLKEIIFGYQMSKELR